MSKMFSKDYYYNEYFILMSPFGEKRVYASGPTKHGANDYRNNLNKKTDLPNNLDGILTNSGEGRFAGLFMEIRHNFDFIGGPDFNFYSIYKHMSIQNEDFKPGDFIKNGSIIGKMGNTGYSKTWDEKIKKADKWRLLTDMEKADPYCSRGVHTHNEFKIVTPILENELIIAMKKVGAITSPDDYFLRKGFVYINPKCVYNYALILQGVKA